MKAQIAILDFGSQYTHLIARRIRQLGVLAQIYPTNVKANALRGVRGLILSGGPQSVHDKSAIGYDPKLFELGVPILGLCYGHQLIAHHLGGKVKLGKVKEYGIANIKQTQPSQLFGQMAKQQQVWMSHGDQVSQLPKGFIVTASSTDCKVAAMVDDVRQMYGLQFHPEVVHTTNGVEMLKHFVFAICQSQPDWSMQKYWQQLQREIKQQVGTRNVFLLVSGGVDSSVAFAILEKILGKKRVFGLHVDNGFMRLNESAQIKKSLAKAGFDDLQLVDAEKQFLRAVKGVVEPEKKRHIIGRTFLQIKDQEMKRHKLNPTSWMLGQGTIYPDTIETGGTKHADTIKTHHNRVKEVLKLMKMGSLIEPLASLYKDEVRQIGQQLKLPPSLINRHPFPGPGLAIRALCSTGRERVSNAAAANRQLMSLVGSKVKASVLPLKSVGVQGDNRTYSHPALVQGKLSWKQLNDLSVRITNQMTVVNRVVYLVSPQKVDAKKIKTIAATLTKQRLELLRQIDHIVNQETRRHKLYQKIWQFPVILAPLSLHGGETIILRPIESREAMTVNFYPMPQVPLKSMVKKISAMAGVDMILYDVTNKPPGTIEWE